jgi:hypothetical protein
MFRFPTWCIWTFFSVGICALIFNIVIGLKLVKCFNIRLVLFFVLLSSTIITISGSFIWLVSLSLIVFIDLYTSWTCGLLVLGTILTGQMVPIIQFQISAFRCNIVTQGKEGNNWRIKTALVVTGMFLIYIVGYVLVNIWQDHPFSIISETCMRGLEGRDVSTQMILVFAIPNTLLQILSLFCDIWMIIHIKRNTLTKHTTAKRLEIPIRATLLSSISMLFQLGIHVFLATYDDNILSKAVVLFVGNNICNAIVVPVMVLTVFKINSGNAAIVDPSEDKKRRCALENQAALNNRRGTIEISNQSGQPLVNQDAFKNRRSTIEICNLSGQPLVNQDAFKNRRGTIEISNRIGPLHCVSAV